MEVIGFVDVEAGEYVKTYEVACWWSKLRVPTQTVEVRLDFSKRAWWTLQGRVFDQYVPSLFCGVPIGGGSVGVCDYTDYITAGMDQQGVCEMVLAGDIRLSAGWGVAKSRIRYRPWCYGFSGGCDHEFHLDYDGAPVNRGGFDPVKVYFRQSLRLVRL